MDIQLTSFILKILTSGLLDKLLAYYQSANTNEAEIAKKHIEAEIERRKVQKELIAVESGWWVTRWCRPFIFYPLAIHIVAIVLDTVFTFGWSIPSLPSPYNELQFAIIMSYYLTRPIEKGMRGYFYKK